MTATDLLHDEPLSVRIAALESACARGLDAKDRARVLGERIAALEEEQNQAWDAVDEGERAARLLADLEQQVARLLDADAAREKESWAPPTPAEDTPPAVAEPSPPAAQETAAAAAPAQPEERPGPEESPPPAPDSATDSATPQPEDEAVAEPAEPLAPTSPEAPTLDPLTTGSATERVLACLEAHPWRTAKEVAALTGLSGGNASGTLSRLKSDGRAQGLGGQYALAGTPRPETSEAPQPAPTPAEPTLTDGPSLRATLLGFLQERPGVDCRPRDIAQAVGAPEFDVATILRSMRRLGVIGGGPDREGAWWFYAPAAAAPAQPTVQTWAPLPPRLSTDEVSVFDALRRESEGLSRRVLASRLGWSQTRTDKVVAALLQAGHLGTNGDRVRVVPPELQGQDGAA